MDGVHDLGGMDGFGPIDRDEATFHAEWERRAFAMVLITMAQGHYGMDEFRHAIERMAPAAYLEATYFERWLAGMEALLVEHDVLEKTAIESRQAEFAAGGAEVPERSDSELAEMMRSIAQSGASPRRGDGNPALDVGDAVRVRNRHPDGHTRCPGYVRRARGTVRAVNGAHVYPDANAHGEGERPQPLYTVRFEGTELWGPGAEPDTAVSVDLWEPYLEPADEAPGRGEND
jgi:nitrile hydratase